MKNYYSVNGKAFTVRNNRQDGVQILKYGTKVVLGTVTFSRIIAQANEWEKHVFLTSDGQEIVDVAYEDGFQEGIEEFVSRLAQ